MKATKGENMFHYPCRIVPCRIVVTVFCGLLLLGGGLVSGATTTRVLRKQHDEYDQALVALGDEDYEVAIAALSELAENDDPSLAADATFFLGRAYLMQERLEEARPFFSRVAERAEFTTHASDAIYYRGLCEAGLLEREKAVETLTAFLNEDPQASQRLLDAAAAKLAELQRTDEGTLDDAHQRMDFARRKLTLHDTGDTTQSEQDNVIDILTRLIGDGENEQECAECAAGT